MLDSDSELRGAVSAELYPGEKLLWVGKPAPLRVVTQYAHRENLISLTIITVLFGTLFFICLSYGVNSISIGHIQIPLISLCVIPLAGLILYLCYVYWRATQIIYAISNRRVLIIKHTIDGRSVRAY